jgi:hypothetical protein
MMLMLTRLTEKFDELRGCFKLRWFVLGVTRARTVAKVSAAIGCGLIWTRIRSV